MAETRRSRRDARTVHERHRLDAYLTNWLKGRRSIRQTTARSYRDALRPVIDRLGERDAESLSKRDLDALVGWMLTEGGSRGTGVSPRTATLTLNVLRRALQDAVREGWLRQNVVDLVERPRQTAREMATWGPEEVERFIRHAEQDRLQAAWLLSLMGLRRGEVLGLRWSDLDLGERPQLSVNQARVLVTSDDIVITAPKTRRGTRVLPLEPVVSAALTSFKALQEVEAAAAGAAYEHSGLVVVSELGMPLRPDVYSARFQRLVEQAGLRRIRLHDLRHTALTLMTLRGVPLPVVAAWAGHADPAFTLRVYAHSQQSEMHRAGRALGLGGHHAS